MDVHEVVPNRLYKGKHSWERIPLKSHASSAGWNQLCLGIRCTCLHENHHVTRTGIFKGFSYSVWTGMRKRNCSSSLYPSLSFLNWHQPWGAAPPRVTEWNSNFCQCESPLFCPTLSLLTGKCAQALDLAWICPVASWGAVHKDAVRWLVRSDFWNAKWCL